MCDYAGYAGALASGNFSGYLAGTNPARFVDWSRCRIASQAVYARQTFFSGHAALAFAGCGYAALFLRRVAGLRAWDTASGAGFATGSPLLLTPSLGPAEN